MKKKDDTDEKSAYEAGFRDGMARSENALNNAKKIPNDIKSIVKRIK